MDKKKKIIIVAVILAITVGTLVWVFTRPEKIEENSQNENTQTETTQQPDETQIPAQTQAPQSEQEVVQTTAPKAELGCTVMYIYADSDEGKDANLEMMAKIEKDYEGKANFNIMNINDEFIQMTGFAIADETPKLLIMTDGGGFSQIANCSDETVIRQEIDKFVN